EIIPEMPVEKCNWFSLYNLHHRSVGTFRQGNVFLAGDAAHIHSPAGGQGMNTGLQDATNLAWKMAGVINGHFDERILSTYNTERLPVARELVKTTDRLFSMMTSPNRFIRSVRNLILPLFFGLIGRKKINTTQVFSRVSQIRIAYRHSPLSLHLSHKTNIRAGDRLPFLQVENPKTREVTNIQQWNHGTGFCLLLLDRLNRIDMPTLRNWLSRNYPTLVDTYYVPYSEVNEPVFSAFEVAEADKKMILVRPDGYIGLIADGVDMLLLQRYFQQMVRSGN
ncbi:MAG: FAD-dependent monooxygenase, partial [Mucilaginibacter polytrichastri]|nr:FAD-dependent monooxygenase [Mucilaginibacter polytrichastri]